MDVNLILLMGILPVVAFSSVITVRTTQAPSICGDWTPYKDVKCLKIATHAGHQTKEDAEIVCQSFSEGLNKESSPRLLTVKTKEEQEFLEYFLFEKNNIVDNVWLGLKNTGNNQDFEWSDGASVLYNNWLDQNITDDQHRCVQLASGKEHDAAGLWVMVTCMKVNVVVCERIQPWNMETLQNTFMNYKIEQGHKLISLQQRNEALEKETDDLKRNPVPLGFIYVQLPNQQPPSSLWPLTKWTDVSASYANLFFRVIGSKTKPFGQIQEEGSPRLAEVQVKPYPGANLEEITIPRDGSWSNLVWTGTDNGAWYYHQFRLSTEEVKPRNQAIKIWQRSQ